MYLHFLKSEAYRASKLKCVYVLLICLFFLTFFQIMIFTKLDFFGMTQDDVYELSEEGYSAEGMSEAFNMGFNSGASISREEADDEQFISSTVVTITDDETGEEGILEPQYGSLSDLWGDGMFYDADMPTLFALITSSSFHILSVAIFTGIFLGAVYKNGYDKNLIVSNRCRATLFFARLTVIAVYSVILLAATFLFTALLDALFTGGVTWNLDSAVLGYTLVSFIISFAFSAVIAAVASFTRNTAASLTVGVLLSMGFLSIGLSLCTMLLKYVFRELPDDFSLINYTLTQNAETLTLDSPGKDVLRALICSFIYSAASIFSSCWIIKKKDIG
ncbi:ABC-2 family transporter protein [Oscillospiraceae bacterium]|nr:ABC-2 family transporter protein [Oscillospiraceae bacterium]